MDNNKYVLLKTWEEFVENCMYEYCFSYFDYTNDLFVRNEIEDIILQKNNNKIFLEDLVILDQKFIENTIKLEFLNNNYWWSNRVPKSMYELWKNSDNWY